MFCPYPGTKKDVFYPYPGTGKDVFLGLGRMRSSDQGIGADQEADQDQETDGDQKMTAIKRIPKEMKGTT